MRSQPSDITHIENPKRETTHGDTVQPQTVSYGRCPFTGASRAPACPVVPLKNYLSSDNVLFDTLHNKSTKTGTPCSNDACQGSIVIPEMPKAKDLQSVNEAEMMDFYKQYYAYHHADKVEMELENRIEDVKREIQSTGHYVMTTEELEFASKTAWRNASRCIGRIQWSKLKLFDGRHVKSTKEMYQIICELIEYGTNGGNIRSGITVFPCRQSGATCRIWNSEFISYAGFEVSPGVIVGDPNHVDLTKICIQLGWKPQIDRFVVLPLVLQYGDNNPEMFIIPESLILEVPIKHPNYPGLSELGLKWFAVPGVSNMSMDCGGLVHPATGFNGWYMSTEIVRDLTDSNRYNMLHEIAESMGLDTSKPALFWKDLAASELNIAIVSSFQSNNVTITDQHTASETFMHHMETEQTLRGGCPADWVWITPPLGGSLTPVFHQEMINYKLKPSYEYQTKPWIGFKWKGKLAQANTRKEKLTLRSVARAMIVCQKLMKSAMTERKQCTILYATETGMSERCSFRLQRQFEQHFNVEVCRMDKYDTKKLKNESLLILITSTFGNGEAPDTGKSFEEFLINDAKKKSSGLWSVNPSEEMTITRYAVFGLGSSAYPNYCAFSKRIDEMLNEIGLKRLCEMHTGDEQKNQETAFRNWSNAIYAKSCQMHGITMRTSSDGRALSDFPQNREYKLVPRDGNQTNVHDGLKKIHGKPVATCSTISVESLVSVGAKWESKQAFGDSADTVLVRLKQAGIDYEPGDHLAVYPDNRSHKVDVICNGCLFDEGVDKDTVVCVKNKATANGTGQDAMITSRLPATSVASALTNYLDIEATPKQSDIERLVDIAEYSEEDKKRLISLFQSDAEYEVWAESKPSWVDLLEELTSLRVPAWFLLSELSLIQPRYYSISSSPLMYPGEVHLTVSILEYSVGKDGRTRHKTGLCSNYLKNIQAGQSVQTFVRKCEKFHMPTSPSHDIIMIGAGSGVAPFRGFWQHKQFLNADPTSDSESLRFSSSSGGGNIYLFQGFRTKSTALHRAEVNKMVTDGTIAGRYTAFSREKHIAKAYIQDKLVEHSDLIYKLIKKNKAHIYVCGDIKMATGVNSAIKSILSSMDTGYDSVAALKRDNIMSRSVDSGISDYGSADDTDMLEEIKEEGRYHEDIFSILI